MGFFVKKRFIIGVMDDFNRISDAISDEVLRGQILCACYCSFIGFVLQRSVRVMEDH